MPLASPPDPRSALQPALPPTIACRDAGMLPDGRPVHEYTLHAGGLELRALTLGGIVTRLMVPDRHGHLANVVLGLPTPHDYAGPHPHIGTLVGRHANRIAGARLVLDGQVHTLSRNDGPHCLHGGAAGFGTRLWRAEPVAAAHCGPGRVVLQLRLHSEDGDQGFPGALDTTVRYALGPGPCWRIDYEARTSRPTVVNLTHHGYFNLAGGGTALTHRLTIPASRFLAVDRHLIPVAVADVAGTPFDFRQPKVVDAQIRDAHPQLRPARGYDHHWLLDAAALPVPAEPGVMHLAARVEDPASGRLMEIRSTEPGVQFYSGNFLDGSLPGADGRFMRQGDGLCLETQHAPDSPHHPEWPTTVLRPGEVFRSSTEHRFGVG